MRNYTISVAAAMAVLGMAWAAPALADCPANSKSYSGGVYGGGLYGYYDNWSYPTYIGTDPDTGSPCYSPYGGGIGTASTGEIVDSGIPGVGRYYGPYAEVNGPNGVALGNGAKVGRGWFVNDNGTPDDASDDFLDNNPVADGTALGARANVQHDHSTAVGADSETDRANQIVLGTEDDEVTVRNLTVNTADKADTAGVVVHYPDGTIASDGGRIQSEIDSNTARNDAQDTTLADHDSRITDNADGVAANASKNVEQDGRLDVVEAGKADKITSDGNSTTSIHAQGVLVEDVDGNAAGLAAEGLAVVDKDDPANKGTIVTGKGVATTGEVIIQGTPVKQTLDTHGAAINRNAGEIVRVEDESLARDAYLLDRADDNASRIDGLEGDVETAYAGIAMALAMESPQVDPDKQFGISLNVGHFEEQTAFAAAAKLRFNKTWAGTAGIGVGTESSFGVRAGIQGQW